jgi:hypothetical protein
MKGGNSNTNGSDLDKNNIIKPTFDTLTKEGCKVLESYHVDLDELFYSRYKMTWQGGILKDATPIIIHKAEVTPEVRPNPPLSLDDIQSMINSALKRQAKSSDELVHRLMEEWNGNKVISAVNFAQTNPQTSGTSTGSTTMPNPSAQSMNNFHS